MGMPSCRVLVESEQALPIVHGGVSSLSGAAEDPDGLEGLSRFSARLMRRTAGGRSFSEVEARIDALGAAVGMDCGHSSTAISGCVLVRNLDEYAELLTEMICAPGLNEEEMLRLKGETIAEFLEVFDDDERLVHRWFTRTLFEGHAYGRTVLGSTASIEAITVENVRQCLRRHFSQGNVVFGFAGAVSAIRVENLATSLSAALPTTEEQPTRILAPQHRHGRHLVFVDKPERTQTQILVGGLGSHPQDADYMALLVANTVFGGTFTARLCQEIRAKRGWSYGAYSSVAYEQTRQAFSLWTFPAAEDAADCLALKLKLLEDWWARGITQKELERAQRYLIQSFAFARDTTSKRVALSLEGILSDLPERHYADYLERVAAVTLDSANAAIRNRISLKNLTVAVVGTHTEVGDRIKDAIEDLSSETVVPFDAP